MSEVVTHSLLLGTVLAAALASGATAAPFLYSVSLNDSTVGWYDAGHGPITAGPDATGNSPSSIVVSPDGKSAYIANSGSNTVSEYDVNAEGGLSPKSTASVSTGVSPQCHRHLARRQERLRHQPGRHHNLRVRPRPDDWRADAEDRLPESRPRVTQGRLTPMCSGRC